MADDAPWKGRVLRTARRLADARGAKHVVFLSVYASPAVWCVVCVAGRSLGRRGAPAEESVLVVPTRWLLFALGVGELALGPATGPHRVRALASSLVAQARERERARETVSLRARAQNVRSR